MLFTSSLFAHSIRRIGIAMFLGIFWATLIPLDDANADQIDSNGKGVEFFEKKIRPLLAANCYECHGAKEQKSGLRLDTWEGMEAGGDTGESLFSDDIETALLIAVLRYEIDDLQMPPEGQLDETQIEDVKHWLELGAPHPDKHKNPAGAPTVKPSDDRRMDHWAFQPLKPVLPPSAAGDWVQTEIDHFIQARHAQRDLTPVDRAGKIQLIRRATFDLWGLPPTPEEVQAFLSDQSPDAYPQLVDRLLASPRYGERWGRHWLDVVRYADSNGLDENIAHGNAWRYRDYIVASFNHDKPYNEFVVEQIAGDRMKSNSLEQRNQRLIATGFLALGPKVLAEADLVKMEMDIIDEQIDTLGRAFLGLTLGCARCHDHKFDPIKSEDYYALAGVFKSTTTMENFNRIARWYEHALTDEETVDKVARHNEKVDLTGVAINRLLAEATKRLPVAERTLALKAREAKFAVEDKSRLAALRAELKTLQDNAPQLPSAMGVTEGVPTDVKIHIRGSHLSLGKLAKRGFPAALTVNVRKDGEQVAANPDDWPQDSSGRLKLANWLVSPRHPLTARVITNRIWRWHFGVGLCSTDNFGLLGAPPTHPKLLDWLAQELIRENWSVKRLQRRIMLSSVYQLGGQPDAKNERIDASNTSYWRFQPRRLEAEAIRDSLFYISGRLDEQMGGSLLHVKNREFFFNHLSKDTTNYVSQRRSLYLPIVRNNLYDVFSLFDYADASVMNGNRASTTVAPQALFMLNSDLVHEASQHLAKRVMSASADDATRIERLFLILYGRQPAVAESDELHGFLSSTQSDLSDLPAEERELLAWKLACQIGIAANEFIYLR